jgi:hypothetical protein
VLDPSLVTGRIALLGALRALGLHVNALIVVGAHAVQEWAAGVDSDFGGSPASLDADLQIDAAALGPDPTLEAAMSSAGFARGSQPGIWISREGAQVDLLVAEAQARGRGSRAARLDPRDPASARRARGLEPCLVLNEERKLAPLDGASIDAIHVRIARPAALIVAKAFKIAERLAPDPRRARAKDALDVLRLLRLKEPDLSVPDFRLLTSDRRFGTIAAEGLTHFRTLFSSGTSPGTRLLRAGYGSQGETLAAQVRVLAIELLERLERE